MLFCIQKKLGFSFEKMRLVKILPYIIICDAKNPHESANLHFFSAFSTLTPFQTHQLGERKPLVFLEDLHMPDGSKTIRFKISVFRRKTLIKVKINAE
jgi:hypothetical protein